MKWSCNKGNLQVMDLPCILSLGSPLHCYLNSVLIFTLTKVKMFSDCVIRAILDHPNCFMTCMIPGIISASFDTVLRKHGNTSVLERRGDDDPGEIYSKFK